MRNALRIFFCGKVLRIRHKCCYFASPTQNNTKIQYKSYVENRLLGKVGGSFFVLLRNALRNISRNEYVLYMQNLLILHIIK